jgi:3',5'-cyclic AMP phosphodiesterase CpdA
MSRPAPTIRFAVFNDLHAQFAPSQTMHPGYPGAATRAEWLFEQLEPGGSLADLDFVMGGGDLIHGENLAAIEVEMAALKKRLDRLPKPFFPCCGNHEVQQREGDDAFESPYRKAFGDDRFDYAIPAGAAEIIVINNAGTYHVGGARREARFHNLQRLLTARPGVPKIVLCHVPLVTFRDPAIFRRSFHWISWCCLEGEILDYLDHHGADVQLVVSGHLHITGRTERQGLNHLVTSGTASFPHDFPVITVTPEFIEVEVRTLPAELHELRTIIHGPPFHRTAYTDADHPTHHEYLRGLPHERAFRLPLPTPDAVNR